MVYFTAAKEAALSEKELTLALMEVAQSTAIQILDQIQEVVPHALTVDKEGQVSVPYLPHEHLEDVGWQDLLNDAADHIRKLVAQDAVSAVALGVELENEGVRGVGIQVESPNETIFQIFPVVEQDGKHSLGEPLDPDSLLIDDLYQRPSAAG
jgi:hypothetical protein